MITDVLDTINRKVKEFAFLDFSVYKYERQELIIAASEDFAYFHNFEIRFKNVFALVSNIQWSVNTGEDVIQLMENTIESYDLNIAYKVEIGNTIFRFITDEGLFFYVIAEDIEFIDKVVKYH